MDAVLLTLHDMQLWLPLVFVLGLVIGSFLNVVHLRMPAWLINDWRTQCQALLTEAQQGRATDGTTHTEGAAESLWTPGSHCTACGHVLRAWENIPLLSWLLLRGRCSACGTSISPRYPLVELSTALFSMLTALQLGASIDALWVLLALWLLIAMAGIDAEHQLLPDLLVYPLLWLGLLRAAIDQAAISASEAILAAASAYLALWLLMHAHQRLRKVQGMGHGDFKLAAALGAWIGLQQLPFLFLLAALAGLLWAMSTRVFSQPLERIPFGPFLALAGWVILLWPDLLMHILKLGGLA
jgi:leader peptidase (prepilin peptidase)/N-methyltransferase